jgi:hypothetical protein
VVDILGVGATAKRHPRASLFTALRPNTPLLLVSCSWPLILHCSYRRIMKGTKGTKCRVGYGLFPAHCLVIEHQRKAGLVSVWEGMHLLPPRLLCRPQPTTHLSSPNAPRCVGLSAMYASAPEAPVHLPCQLQRKPLPKGEASERASASVATCLINVLS